MIKNVVKTYENIFRRNMPLYLNRKWEETIFIISNALFRAPIKRMSLIISMKNVWCIHYICHVKFPESPEICEAVKNCETFLPCFLFHLHLILLLPIAYWPAGHFNMQVAEEHSSSSPASNPCAVVGVPQFCQSAAAFMPTGNPQSPFRCFAIAKAWKYVGCSHSATTSTGKIDFKSFLVSDHFH